MPCDHKTLPDGAIAIVCSRRGKPSRCRYCGQPGGLLCDYPVERNGERTTCDTPLCRSCATKLSGERDLCRAHVPLWDFAMDRPRIGPAAREEA